MTSAGQLVTEVLRAATRAGGLGMLNYEVLFGFDYPSLNRPVDGRVR